MAISPDSQWLATGGSDRTVRIWDAASGQARALMRVEDVLTSQPGYCIYSPSFGWAMKNSYMASLASGPSGSVKMLPGVPPDQAWPIPPTL